MLAHAFGLCVCAAACVHMPDNSTYVSQCKTVSYAANVVVCVLDRVSDTQAQVCLPPLVLAVALCLCTHAMASVIINTFFRDKSVTMRLHSNDHAQQRHVAWLQVDKGRTHF